MRHITDDCTQNGRQPGRIIPLKKSATDRILLQFVRRNLELAESGSTEYESELLQKRVKISQINECCTLDSIKNQSLTHDNHIYREKEF